MSIEYNVLQATTLINKEQLESLAESGWELVSVVYSPANNDFEQSIYIFYFKRFLLPE